MRPSDLDKIVNDPDKEFDNDTPMERIIPKVFIAVAGEKSFNRYLFLGESEKEYYSVTEWLEEDFGFELEDMIDDLPTEPGIYRCEIKFWVTGPDQDGDRENGMKVVKAEKIYVVDLGE